MSYIEILEKADMNIDVNSNTYIYGESFVPRVTEIISSTIHEDYLLHWANHLGFKRKSYAKTLDWYADVGTLVHSIVEDILLKGYSTRSIPRNMEYAVSNAVYGFMNWFTVISSTDYNIISTEQRLVCEWFGGTCDLLIEINGKNYLIDFKTSKKVSFKHHLQLAAYKYMHELQGTRIDGVGVLLLSRDRIEFQEHLLHMDNPEHKKYMDHCTNAYFAHVSAYYNRVKTEMMFNELE